mgnify:CR=1 FL=1
MKILFVTGSRGEWGYIRPILRLIEKDPELDYDLCVTNMHLLPGFGQSENEILNDWWSPDLFHETKPLDNNALVCYLYEQDLESVTLSKEILKFPIHKMKQAWEVLGDEEADKLVENHCAIPEYVDNVDNILCSFDENKGGIYEFVFDSDTVPTPEDFYYTNGCIETPEGDWDYVDKIFFKGKELEIEDYLDNSGKAATVEIYMKDDKIIR